jgi:hypothetical protein
MKKTSEVYPRLYHYTTLQGLQGILKNQCIWATHYKFLNDCEEIIAFRPKLTEFLYPLSVNAIKEIIPKYPRALKIISAKGGLEAVARHETETYVDAAYSALSEIGDGFYIASFCGTHDDCYLNDNGLLSQWRAYGRDGGFSIEFRTHDLEEMLHSEIKDFHYNSLLLADVVYSDDEEKYKAELEPTLHEIARHCMETFIFQLQERADPPYADRAFDAFIQCISRYKHRGFKEEHEVRIVSLPTVMNGEFQEVAGDDYCKSKPDKNREFRDQNGNLIPYIELFCSTNKPLPIERIIVGPQKNKEARAAALRVMLRNTDIKITTSEIPYIG